MVKNPSHKCRNSWKLTSGVSVPLVLLVLFLLGFASCSTTKEHQATNLIIITLDTTRADRLGCYGYAGARTPNLDRIAQEGILFENAVCSCPSTVPSHASIMTGLYPQHHGVRVTGSHRLVGSRVTLADTLKNKGYATGAVISGYPLTKDFGLNKGFDFYDDSFYVESENQKNVTVERIAEKSIGIALKWLEKNKDSRLFFWLHLYDPHSEYSPPEPFHGEFRDALYDGEIAYMDWSLGPFFKKLRELGLYDSSLIIIAGDHGEALGEHEESEHQFLLYNSTMRVPFLIRPGGKHAQKKISQLVGLTDIFPTVLEILNIKHESKVDGRSLMPLIENPSEKDDEHSYYLETLASEIALGWSPLYAIMNNKWKYIEAPEPELYDLSNDPPELHNILSREKDRAEKMRADLNVYLQEIPGSGVTSEMQLDEEAMKNLASLGYISSGSFSKKGATPLKDPKKYIYIEKDINALYKLCPMKKYDEAFPHIEAVLKADPENRLALLYAGTAYFELKDNEKAFPYLEKLYQYYQHEVGNELLIRIYISRQELQKALEVCDSSIEHFPNRPQFPFWKGGVLIGMKQYAVAIKSLNDASSLGSTDPEIYYGLALCNAILGREDESIAAVRESLKKGFTKRDMYLKNPAFRRMKRFKEIENLIASQP